MLFDALAKCGAQAQFDRIFGFASAAGNISVGLSCLAGSVLAGLIGYPLVLVLSIASCLASFLVACTFEDIKGSKSEAGNLVKDALSIFFRKPDLTRACAMLVMSLCLGDILDEYDGLIATSYHIPLTFVGVWIATRSVLQAIGSALADRLKWVSAPILAVMGGLLLLLSSFLPSWVGVVCCLLFYAFLAAAQVQQEGTIQASISKEGRSTIRSVVSLATNLHAMLVFALLALLPSLDVIIRGVAVYCLATGLFLSDRKNTSLRQKNS